MRSLTFENSRRRNERREDRREREDGQKNGDRRDRQQRDQKRDRFANRDRDNRDSRDSNQRFERDEQRRPKRVEDPQQRRPRASKQDAYEDDLSRNLARMKVDKEQQQQARTSKRYSSLRQQRAGDANAAGGQYDSAMGAPFFDQANSQHSPGYFNEQTGSQPAAHHSPGGSFGYDSPTSYPDTVPAGFPPSTAPMAAVLPSPATAYMPSYPPSGYPQYPPPPTASYIPAAVPPPPPTIAAAPPPPPPGPEMFRGGVTYYDPSIQQPPRNLPPKRPKTVLPIVPPPGLSGQGEGAGDAAVDSSVH